KTRGTMVAIMTIPNRLSFSKTVMMYHCSANRYVDKARKDAVLESQRKINERLLNKLGIDFSSTGTSVAWSIAMESLLSQAYFSFLNSNSSIWKAVVIK